MMNKAVILLTSLILGGGLYLYLAEEPDSRPPVAVHLETATFAGGCFWCIESDFESVAGVYDAVSGYTGGTLSNPDYRTVSGGGTGHLEAVQVHYDPQVISYEELLEAFWRQIDPTDPDGQFVDRGHQYSTAIFYKDEVQRRLAEYSILALERSGRYGKPIVTVLRPLGEFYEAETYHQDYHSKNPLRYSFYRGNSGRNQYLEQIWGADPLGKEKRQTRRAGKFMKPSDEELREKLTPLQYEVTQQEGTERPFDNLYWNEKRDGIYVDVVSGEPLFSSLDKYDSGSGWPSFTKPLREEMVNTRTDFKLLYPRTEVRSKLADSHLGHLFDDGPAPTGLRYCVNSASLRFIPRHELAAEGYGEWLALFDRE